MRVVNVGIGGSPPSLSALPITTAAPNSLKERVGDGFPMLAVLTLVGVLIGAIIKVSQDA